MTEPAGKEGYLANLPGEAVAFFHYTKGSMEKAGVDYRGMSHRGASATCNRAWESQTYPKAKANGRRVIITAFIPFEQMRKTFVY
jgi:hypothetical protein